MHANDLDVPSEIDMEQQECEHTGTQSSGSSIRLEIIINVHYL